MSATYRKTVEACRWDGTVEDATRIIDWLLSVGETARFFDDTDEYQIGINMPECRTRFMNAGEWVVREADGQVWVCPDASFTASYAPDTSSASDTRPATERNADG